MSSPIRAKRWSVGVAAIVRSGRADSVKVLPTATPMRRVPKSKPSNTAPGGSGSVGAEPPSGMPGGRGQEGGVDAEQPERPEETFVDGRVEDQVRAGLDGEPGVARHLFLELARAPARIAER